jgi:tRNA threonylcarbamoyl adenosine modification protein (Sua5/YciO/YrdC/YwlC family)
MITKVYTLFPSSPNERDLLKVANELQKGALVIYPTDTVYAIGCLSSNTVALDKFSRLKDIKLEKAALSFLFKDISELSSYVKPFDASIFRLLKNTLPGPYSFIMESNGKLPKPFHKRKTIGVRISDHPVLKSLLPMLDAPLLTSSLHDEDEILQYTSDETEILSVWDGKVDVLIQAGPGGNIPSTVVDLTDNSIEVIRHGKGEVDFI